MSMAAILIIGKILVSLMYENLYLKGIGSFEPDSYWSSSEIDAGSAWSQYFGARSQGYSSKVSNLDNRVRAVRAFN